MIGVTVGELDLDDLSTPKVPRLLFITLREKERERVKTPNVYNLAGILTYLYT